VAASKVERVQEEQVFAPHSDMGEQEQSVAASPTVLPKFYFADSV